MALPWNFAGGLTQTDIFGLGTGFTQTAAASAAYNQAAYFACLQLRQNQLYQDKNYHISWVSVARDDIRSVMEASTNRMNNYVLVGTLILQTAIGMLFGDTLSGTRHLFVVGVYWQTMALSVMFFTTSIVFSVKGQNSAFLNTMRLLMWETRPENPGAYDHDYMQQIRSFEGRGLKEVFRMPMTRATDFAGPPAAKGKAPPADESMPRPLDPAFGGHADGQGEPHGKLETLTPTTEELLYLARMGQCMQIWSSYDTFSKYCLGLGLVLMVKGAVYWCLGQLAAKDTQMADFTAGTLMAVFTYVNMLIYRESFKSRYQPCVFALCALLLSEPLTGMVAVFFEQPRWVNMLFQLLNVLSQMSLFVAALAWSTLKEQRPAAVAQKYLEGPAGQRFSSMWTSVADRDACAEPRVSGGVDADSDRSFYSTSSASSGFTSEEDHSESDGPWKPPRRDGTRLTAEEQLVAAVERRVRWVFRIELLLSAGSWLLAFVVLLLSQWRSFGVWAEGLGTPALELEALPLAWHSPFFQPTAMACAGGHAFAANSFTVARLDFSSGMSVPYPCNANRTIRDITVLCEAGGACRPLVLLNDTRVVDCSTGAEFKLLQSAATADSVQRFAMYAGGAEPDDAAGSYNSSLMAATPGSLVEYAWRPASRGWAPQWTLKPEDTLEVQPRGCTADALDNSGCRAARRLRVRSHMGGGSGGSSGSGGRRKWRQGVVQRSGRVGMLMGGEAEEESEEVIQATIQNLAWTSAGLLLFEHVKSSRGWVNRNVLELVDVPSLDLLGAWHVPEDKPLISAGCAWGESSVLVLQGAPTPKVYRAAFSIE